MDDAVPVGVVEGTERARGDLQRPLRQQAASAGENLPQRHAVDVFHDDVGHDRRLGAVDVDVFAGVIDGDDVGMIQ